MLDTDVLIEIKRERPDALVWLASQAISPPVCVFAALELMFGCQNAKERRDALVFLEDFVWLSPTEQGLLQAVEEISAYKLSHGLSGIDGLIAATALEYDLPLYTFNVRHFNAIPNLKVVLPYKRTTR